MTTKSSFISKISILALAGASLAAMGSPRMQAQARTDSQIEMDVVQALDSSDALKNDLITAATIQNEVTISGTVSSDASKKLAESLCSHVAGVTKVHNNLKVGDPQAAAQAQDMSDPSQYAGDPMNDQGGYQGTADPSANQARPTYQSGQQYPQPQRQPYPQQNQQYPQGQQPYPPQQAQGPYGDQYPQGQPYPGQQPPPYGQPYPDGGPQRGGRGFNSQPPAPPQAFEFAKSPVTVAPGSVLQLRTIQPVSAKNAREGTPVDFIVMQDVALGNVLAIPRGAMVHGVVTLAHKAGSLGGSSELALRLISLDLSGQNYALTSDQFLVKGPNKAGHTAGNAIGGALLGALIGGAVGRGSGAAIGAGAGAVAGTAASAASPGPDVWIPSEAQVTFRLQAPVTLAPVTPQEANRLAQGLYQGGPQLYPRQHFRQPYYPGGGAAYVYPAPSVYYRPYYMVGGAYYWR